MAKKGAHFRCPQHYCAVCQKSGDGVDMVKCIRCPTAYHSSCMPKDIQRLLPHAKVWPHHHLHIPCYHLHIPYHHLHIPCHHLHIPCHHLHIPCHHLQTASVPASKASIGSQCSAMSGITLCQRFTMRVTEESPCHAGGAMLQPRGPAPGALPAPPCP